MFMRYFFFFFSHLLCCSLGQLLWLHILIADNFWVEILAISIFSYGKYSSCQQSILSSGIGFGLFSI